MSKTGPKPGVATRHGSALEWYVPAVVSVSVHAGLLLLVAQAQFSPLTNPAASTPASAEGDWRPPIPEPARVGNWIDESVRKSENVPVERRLSELARSTREFEKIASQKSVAEIADMVQRTVGARQRAYAPVAKPPAGPFDIDSSLIHSTKTKEVKGKPTLFYVLVDKDGRTMEVEAPDNGAAPIASALEQMNRSPVLKSLFEQVVLPVLDTRSKEERRHP